MREAGAKRSAPGRSEALRDLACRGRRGPLLLRHCGLRHGSAAVGAGAGHSSAVVASCALDSPRASVLACAPAPVELLRSLAVELTGRLAAVELAPSLAAVLACSLTAELAGRLATAELACSLAAALTCNLVGRLPAVELGARVQPRRGARG